MEYGLQTIRPNDMLHTLGSDQLLAIALFSMKKKKKSGVSHVM